MVLMGIVIRQRRGMLDGWLDRWLPGTHHLIVSGALEEDG